MAKDTITAFTINTLLVGLLIIGLTSGFILLANNEGRGEIFDDYPQVENFNLNMTDIYTNGELVEVANANSNLSADYNTEIAISAADRKGNVININLQDIATLTWTSINVLGVILFGNIYSTIISGLVIALVGYVTVAYSIKAIRTGQT